MPATPSIKKQFKVAFYTSPLIAAMAITPISILNRYSFNKYLIAVLFTMSLVLTLWTANIYLWKSSKGSSVKRYLVSSLVNVFIAWGVSAAMLHSGSFNLGGRHDVNFHFHIILFLAINTVILILQDLLITREKKAAVELENQELRLKNMEAINQQLKQQIQPHFLFNSLSTLKSLMGVNPESAEEYLVRLSDFLRSSLSSHLLNTISLNEELQLCVNYLEMQKIRFGEALQFDIHIPPGVEDAYCLPVLSLQQLAENAIKHNVLTVDRPLRIAISWLDGVIKVSNNLQVKETMMEGTRVGLVNLKERYRILSGRDIVVEESEENFTVSIKALVYESSNH